MSFRVLYSFYCPGVFVGDFMLYNLKFVQDIFMKLYRNIKYPQMTFLQNTRTVTPVCIVLELFLFEIGQW